MLRLRGDFSRAEQAYRTAGESGHSVQPGLALLEGLGNDLGAPYLRAVAESARGAALLADGDAHAACAVLRRAWTTWQELGAPYEAARVRLSMAQACRELADHDTATMELDAARRVSEQLGAAYAFRHELV